MKRVILFIGLSLILNSCSDTIGQLPSKELEKEQEFNNLMKKVNETRAKNQTIISSVDKKTTEVIEKTAETISTLKEENKKLKNEINETGKKYYPIDDTVSGIKFTLRPVSNGKENR